jgi:hypothetical protein
MMGGNWDHIKRVKILELHTGKARNQGTTDNSHTGHWALISESANVKVQNIQHGK